MVTKHEAQVTKHTANNKVTVVKEFDASVEKVWSYWTESNKLDQWWAPKPWKAETTRMNFKEGGSWQYAMVGPEGERHHALVEYTKINAPKSFSGVDAFADEKGNKNPAMPSANWEVRFSKTGTGARVEVLIAGNNDGDVERLLEMGFEEGFKLALENLDDLLSR